MHLTALKLKNFRSYENITLTPPQGITVIAGENGTGKTNLLEAVHLCCLGRSHRTNTDTDMIMNGTETAAVQVSVERRDGRHDTGVRLFHTQKRKKICLPSVKNITAKSRRFWPSKRQRNGGRSGQMWISMQEMKLMTTS